MSWQTFKKNILRVANNPQSIDDIDIVARTYATEYDDAVKRGGDTINGIPIQRGNVDIMEQIFKSALQKGLSSTEPYDLVGEMGKGVVAYWTGAIMENDIPLIPAIGAASNTGVVRNIVINSGTWAPVAISAPTSFQLTPEERVEYEVELEEEITKFDEAKLVDEPDVLATREDKVSNLVGVLLQNEEYRTTIPYTAPIVTVATQLVDIAGNVLKTNGTLTPNPNGLLDGGDYFEFDLDGDGVLTKFPETPVFPPPPPPAPEQGEIYSTPAGGPFQKSIPFFPAGASIGEKCLAIALTDLKDGVVENPKGSDTGHPRIIEMQTIGQCGTKQPWCACAVSTWWTEAGISLEGHKNKAYVPTWWDWAATTNRLVDVRNGLNKNYVPKVGDAVIYGWDKTTDHRGFDHIGIVAGFDENGSFYGIDGNWGASVGYNRVNKKAVRGFVVIG